MIFDIVVAAAILISTVIAFLRGFIREVLTIVGVLGGLVAAYFGGPLLDPVISGWLGAEEKDAEGKRFFDILPYDLLTDIFAYGSIFIVVVIVLSVASHFLAHGARAIGLGAIDRVLGVAFGVVRGVLMLALFYLPVYLLAEEDVRDGWFKGSHTMPFVEVTTAWLAEFLPDSFTENIEDKAMELEEKQGEQIRQKLKEIDILAPAPEEDSQSQETGGPGPGYEEDTRGDMDRIIEEELNDDNETE